MRGEAQIRAAARDDQVTAERNGNKRDWRRETLGKLLDKLEEEYREFVKDVMEGNREGMRWEGSDLRWCVTMIQDHHGVLELEEADECCVQLEEDNELLREGYQRTLDIERGERDERIQQLEEAIGELRSSFEARMERAAPLVDEGVLNDYWRGNHDALEVCLHGLAALSSEPSEAPEKEEK